MFLPVKNPESRQYSFQKLTLFSSGNNVVESPLSNIYGFLQRDAHISSIHLNRHVLNKVNVSPTLRGRQCFLQNLNQILTHENSEGLQVLFS
jgi:hypothetical protein